MSTVAVAAAAAPLLVLVASVATPAALRGLRGWRGGGDPGEAQPLLAAGAWVLAACADADAGAAVGAGAGFYAWRFGGHVVSLLLALAAAQWELAKELGSDGRGESAAGWAAGILLVFQMGLAWILFVHSAKVVKPGVDNDICVEFQKRHNRMILFRLAGFHVLSAGVWAFLVLDAWPLFERGDISTRVFALAVFMVFGGFIMSVLCLLVRTSIVTRKIHRAKVDGKIPSPELDASILSRLAFSWFDPMMSYGYKHTLVFSDLYDINPSENIKNNLLQYHQIQHRKPTPLLTTLWKMNWLFMIQQFGLVLMSTILYFSGPFFLNRILNHLTNRGVVGKEDPEWMAYVYVFGILATALTRFALEGQISLMARKLGIRIRNTLSGLIYRKSLIRVPKLALDDERADKKAESGDGNNSGGSGGASVGKIVNLMSVDAGNVGEWVGMIYTPVITFIQIVLCVLSLLFILGWPAIAGVILMTVLMFSGAPLASSINSTSYTLKSKKDERINSMNELLQGIKIIKLFAWEKQFEKRVTAFRETELAYAWRLLLLLIYNRVLWYSAPILTTFVTLGTFTKIAGRDLDATTAFTTLALFNLLRGPLQTFPDTLVNLLDVWVSVKRIKGFLKEEDLERFGENETLMTGGDDGEELSLENATFEWPKSEIPLDATSAPTGFFKRVWQCMFSQKYAPVTAPAADVADTESTFQLSEVNVLFPAGKLSVVVGATGSGKTSLLLSLLGETRRLNGTRKCPGTVAYVSQTAWLTNATIRQNILFGAKWNPVRYRRVVQACALVKDFEVLDGGDQTEVGEKGINLSGGQKQRISLARAAYSSCPYVLLDDPLSAVDAPTARHLFEKCILGLLANRTRVLVTNAVGLAIPCADHLIVVNSGRVTMQGTVENVMSDILQTTSKANIEPNTPFADGLAELADVALSERSKYLTSRKADQNIGASLFLEELDSDTEAPVYTAETPEVGGTKLTQDEKMEDGHVKMKVYGLYFQAIGGLPFFLVLLAGYCLNHGLATLQDVVVAWWSNEYTSNSTQIIMGTYGYSGVGSAVPLETHWGTWVIRNGTMPPPRNGETITDYYLTLYGIVGGICIVSILVRLLILNYGQICAARTLHKAMLARILRAPLRFFEVTPLGRIMNRFTKDMASIDWEVGNSAASLTYFIVSAAFVIGTVTAVIPLFIVFLIPIGYVYVRIGLYYIRTSRSLKRVESIARSPIFSHFSETLNGVTTIRAFNELTRFSNESHNRFNDSNRATYFLAISNLWLSMRIQAMGTCVVFCAGVLVVAMPGVGAGLAGLCLNFTLTLTDTLIALVRVQSWMEMAMNSIERCDEYMNIEQEAADIIMESRPPSNWPHEGRISIQNLEMRYSNDSPMVLHGISVEIGAREKVGVVGRTGAGKSTLTMAMFRIIEPAGGKIVIDGVDVSQIGLEDLRSRLTIIPQDPVLFAGTVRSNIDPFGTMNDADLWAALKRAHLVPSSENSTVKEVASSSTLNTLYVEDGLSSKASTGKEFSLTLDSPISEGGQNLSAGQRQLLCLARALAKGSKVIMLDEATASVDSELDGRIQSTIRTEFAGATVLTIAHRLKTIVDYDRVIVLDHGQVIENGRPIDLIENSKVNVFRKMCEETGEFEELVAIARASGGVL